MEIGIHELTGGLGNSLIPGRQVETGQQTLRLDHLRRRTARGNLHQVLAQNGLQHLASLASPSTTGLWIAATFHRHMR